MEISSQPASAHPWGDAPTPYEELGGEAVARSLAEAFYDRVEATSPVLTEMLPADTTLSREKLYEFLSGWLGGPQLYWERRGHPRLRMRHARFAIDDHAAAEWMRCMGEALDQVGAESPVREFLAAELGTVATHLRNLP